jgi:hypothetical protein
MFHPSLSHLCSRDLPLHNTCNCLVTSPPLTEIIAALATAIDDFLRRYKSPTEALVAKALCEQVTEALTLKIYPPCQGWG